MDNLNELTDEQLEQQLNTEIEPESQEVVAIEEPDKDNLDIARPNEEDNSKSDLKADLETKPDKDNLVNPDKNAEPDKDNLATIIDDSFIASHPDIPKEYLLKFKGKNFGDILKSAHNIEKLYGKTVSELQLIRNESKLKPSKDDKPIDTAKDSDSGKDDSTNNANNVESIIEQLASISIKEKYPDFSEEWVSDLALTDPMKLYRVMKDYDQVKEQASKDAVVIEDWRTNAHDYNWNEAISAIDSIKDELADREVDFEDLGLTNQFLIDYLKARNVSNISDKQEENLALALLLDDNGKLDKTVFTTLYGKDKLIPDLIVRKFINSTKEKIREVKQTKKMTLQTNARKEGFKDALDKKPQPLLSSSNTTGHTKKPVVKNLNELSDAELETTLEQVSKGTF